MRTLIVHKDADTARHFLAYLSDDHQGEDDKLHDVGSMIAALNLSEYDVVLFDLVTISGNVLCVQTDAAPALRNYLRFFPGTRIVLHYTTGSGIAQGVVEEVKETYPDADIVLLDCMADEATIISSVTGRPAVPH